MRYTPEHTNKNLPRPLPRRLPNESRELLRRLRHGDRSAYLKLFVQQLPALERFVKHEIHYAEASGAIERGLIDPCAVIDQVYIAGVANLKRFPTRRTFRAWLRELALHILRQQAIIEHREEPIGRSLELAVPKGGNEDSELWEYYQPDDVVNVEDVVSDRSAIDPEAWVELREMTREIEAEINALPRELRECFVLRVIEELSLDEIATLKHQEPEDVRLAVRAARAALRQERNAPPAEQQLSA